MKTNWMLQRCNWKLAKSVELVFKGLIRPCLCVTTTYTHTSCFCGEC